MSGKNTLSLQGLFLWYIVIPVSNTTFVQVHALSLPQRKNSEEAQTTASTAEKLSCAQQSTSGFGI